MILELKITAESVQELQEILKALGHEAPRVEVKAEPAIAKPPVQTMSIHKMPETKRQRTLSGKGCIHLEADGTCWYCDKKDELMYVLCERCEHYKQKRNYRK